jgi:oligo-1,6-glucosidase
MTNAPVVSLDDIDDVEARNFWVAATAAQIDPRLILAGVQRMGRDNARTPMQWDASAHAGFSTIAPWLPTNPNYLDVNSAAAQADSDSVWHHYRRLIELRHNDPIVTGGRFTMLLADDPYVYAYRRELGDDGLLVLGNFSGQVRPLFLPELPWTQMTLELANYAVGPGTEVNSLRPWECRVYRIVSTGG